MIACNFNRQIIGNKIILTSPGINFGGRVLLLLENEHRMLVRVSGSVGWCGRGASKYYEPYFEVYEKVFNDKHINATLIKDFRYSRKTKELQYSEALKIFNKKEKYISCRNCSTYNFADEFVDGYCESCIRELEKESKLKKQHKYFSIKEAKKIVNARVACASISKLEDIMGLFGYENFDIVETIKVQEPK